jgi:tRNA pseudouridine synthase 9
MSVNYVHDDGKPSTTIFTRLGFNGKTSVVRCKPLTGRTHQIRVHLRYLGFPISNDPLYGFNTGWSPMLHPGEQMKEEEARLLVDKLFEFSPIEDWGTDGVQKTTAEGDRCNECSAVILPRDCQDHLCIYLHAWRYSGNNWDYETELPFWAKQDFDENKTPPQFVFNSKKAIV